MIVPYFSVVVPVYNRASSIMPILNSVINQKFTNWEMILVDDGSRDVDELALIISEINDDRIKLICRSNGGGGAARNTGIDASIGKYIALLDSDDLFLENKLQDYHEFLECQSDTIHLAWSKFHVDRGNGKDWIKPDRGPLVDERIDEYLTCTTGWIQTSTMVVEGAFAKKIRFSEKLPSSQDTDFAVRCFLNGANFHFFDKCYSIMNDMYDPNRVSKQSNVTPLLSWVEEMKSKGMSKKSYLGFKGWQCARIESESNVFSALKLYLPSLIGRAFTLKTSVRVFLQIVIKQEKYHKLMSLLVLILGKRVKND